MRTLRAYAAEFASFAGLLAIGAVYFSVAIWLMTPGGV